MNTKIYHVNCVETNRIIINGQGNNATWDKAVTLTDFVSPWETKPIDKIEFKAVHDNVNLFFLFKVYDPQVHINKNDDSINSINNSDRVELFFRTDASLTPYYCLEIDPTPRLMDFKAHPNKQFDFNWDWPVKDIQIKSSINEKGFTVEGAISLRSLTDYGLLKDGKIETGVYRAKYHQQQDGSYEPTWITWVNPNTETPNFHIASSFGLFKLT
ncbi:carbohydrate-binding family 9-like protein [Flavivirga spongiicola]|uniref:Carbohydrate-binding family 9-like protein n=1 Tax=Flavivirga spongiicola TaxID=421621 RepID=A0ABU7XXQ0_9FLAO|nr:carbohydrate-binding family 9-like protein [Flavivirga sp. MEBiC05379]MDO5980238.1 carbohydrate-binding family 9-like protein [Flavivirga sp. MEBiC05379]